MTRKLILHLGMPKTGTTTLQSFLTQNYKILLGNGILYPKVKTNLTNHNFLVLPLRQSGVFNPSSLLRYPIDKQLQLKLFKQEVARVRSQVNKYNPHTIILSSEVLFPGLNKTGDYKTVFDCISDLADIVIPVFYVRQPSDFYQSAVVQKLKSSHNIPVPKAIDCRTVIESTSRYFGSSPEVIKFKRDELLGGSITKDFSARFLQEAPNLYTSDDLNRSLSAESMFIIQQFRLYNYPDQDTIPNTQTKRLQQQLQQIEYQLKITKKVILKARVREFIDSTSLDLLWLRDEHNIVFTSVDYEKVGRHSQSWQVETMEDIFELDPDLINAIYAKLLYDWTQSTSNHFPVIQKSFKKFRRWLSH